MSTESGQVLITDAHSNPALAATRSLGRLGFRVTVVAEHGRMNLAGSSRFAARVVTAPPSAEQPQTYLRELKAELTRTAYALLLPVTDTTVAIVDRDRRSLDCLTCVALPPSDVLRHALDKGATLELARTVGVSTPETHSFSSTEEALRAADRLRYPCFVKPRFSRWWNGIGTVRSGTVKFVGSARAFRETYPGCHEPEAPPLVQSFISGQGVGVFALVDRGRVVATFAHRRIREKNPAGGAASLAESIEPEDRFVTPASQMLEAIQWHGLAMVEFKDPGANKPPILMEINGRLWGSLPLAIAAGVDFPRMLADLLLERRIAVPAAYRVGIRCRHLRGDLSHLAGVMRGAPEGWPTPFPGRLRTLLSLVSWPGRWRPYNFRLLDPWPSAVESADFISRDIASSRVLQSKRVRATHSEEDKP